MQRRLSLVLVSACVAATATALPLRTSAGLPQAAGDTAKKKKADLPLASARRIEFTTSKATWMSLDVSPDGRTIVFDLLGNLYTLPVAGGKATRITSGLEMDVQPRFSPDGKRLAFVSGRSGGDNVWVMSVDGKDNRQITN